jgi:hypothetical protein
MNLAGPDLTQTLGEWSDLAFIVWVRMDDGSFAFAIVDPNPPEAA